MSNSKELAALNAALAILDAFNDDSPVHLDECYPELYQELRNSLSTLK